MIVDHPLRGLQRRQQQGALIDVVVESDKELNLKERQEAPSSQQLQLALVGLYGFRRQLRRQIQLR